MAAGQLLFKVAANDIAGKAEGSLLQAMTSRWLLLAIAVYAAATALWILVLTREPLSRAYPFVLAGALLVPLLAGPLFGERLPPSYWIGLIAVLIGIYLTQING